MSNVKIKYSSSFKSHEQPPPTSSQSNNLDHLEDLNLQLQYNNNLQVLYKRELVKLEIKKRKQQVEEKLSNYQNNLKEKQNAAQIIDDEINLLQKKSEVIESLNAPEGTVMKTDYLSTASLELKNILLDKCKNLKLKNIEPLHSQDQINMLCDTFKNFGESLELINKNVTKNPAEIHDFAGQIKKFSDLQQNIEDCLEEQEKNSDELIRATISKLSNALAK